MTVADPSHGYIC